VLFLVAAAATFTGCATESSQSLPVPDISSAQTPYASKPVEIAVGKFDNQSSYMRGLFSDGVDCLGSQAKTVLVTRLQQSRRFNVLDRGNLDEGTDRPQATCVLPHARRQASHVLPKQALRHRENW